MSISHQSVLVLGSSGLLGSQLLSGNYLRGYQSFGQGRGAENDIQVDLEDIIQVRDMLAKTQPAAIINLIGLTSVDFCEQFPSQAYKVNVRTLQNVLEAVRSLPCKPRLIHISTDQVYDGLGPHREEDVTLTNYYAFSKYAAELVATAAGGMVLRTNFFGKSRTAKRKSITDWLKQELIAGHNIQVFEDVLFSPLSMHSLCEVIGAAVESRVEGVFNLGAKDGMSKAEFAFHFAECLGLPKTGMSRVKTSDVDFLKTYRPKDMRLNVSAVEKAMKISLPTLTAEIELVSREYRA
jgi:dTDP-4-dehydrorhamnose reductase